LILLSITDAVKIFLWTWIALEGLSPLSLLLLPFAFTEALLCIFFRIFYDNQGLIFMDSFSMLNELFSQIDRRRIKETFDSEAAPLLSFLLGDSGRSP